MKKTIMIALMATIAFTVKAQKDYSKDVVREVDEYTKEIKILSPQDDGFITISKIIDPGYSLCLAIFRGYDIVPDTRSHGIYIKFEDDSVLTYPDIKVDCSYPGGSKYFYLAPLKITDENISILSTKKITKYKIGYVEVKLSKKESEKIIAYFKKVYESN